MFLKLDYVLLLSVSVSLSLSLSLSLSIYIYIYIYIYISFCEVELQISFSTILLDIFVGLTPFHFNKKYRKGRHLSGKNLVVFPQNSNPNDNLKNRCHSKIILGHAVFQLFE